MKRWKQVLLTIVLLLLAGCVAIAAFVARPYPIERLDPDHDAPLRIVDRRGQLLRKVPSATGRREAWVSIADMPSTVPLAALASEDDAFFEHGGIDPLALGRAAWLDLQRGRFAYGGSTISMQLAKMLCPRIARRTLSAKALQIVDALRLERALSKNEILEHYLNRAYYGNGAYGIEAAAQLYFGKPARALGLGEATLLAVIPRAPTQYDPLLHLDTALHRRAHVLSLLVEKQLLSNTERRVAEAEPVTPSAHAAPFAAPHFVDLVLAQLPPSVKVRGGLVRTTLDLDLQARLEHRVAEHVAGLAEQSLKQAGVVVLDTRSGEIRALVGSAAYTGKDGQNDIASLRRHPGSALKPFVYATAIEGGASPASIAVDASDVPSEYRVEHPDARDRGPVRYREALAGSLNLAAVHVLEEVGVEHVLAKLRSAGLGPFPEEPSTYGLRLALGSSTVRLLDLASAYGFLVRDGNVISHRAIVEIERTADVWLPPPQTEARVFSPQASWLVMDMLSDAAARRPRFGDELPFDLPYPVAAKTGTSRGFADTVAVAVTREWTVAAWGGNFDGKPTDGLRAMQSAAPLVRDGLLAASDGKDLTLPRPPSGLVTRAVCALSGASPGDHCPRIKRDYFRADVAPSGACAWHQADGVHLPAIYDRWASRRNESVSSSATR